MATDTLNDGDKIRLGFPAFRVFIYGLEVTKDVTAISTTFNDASAPNQCQITLNSKFDRYIINSYDIAALNGIDASKVKTRWGTSLNNNQYVEMDPIKEEILSRKGKFSQRVSLEDRIDPFGLPATMDSIGAKYFDDIIKDYPITDGSPVFHAMDPVRVFFRDPFNPANWYHKFCGFVSDMTEQTNENNVKTLTLLAEDPTKLFRYTRVAVNPGILDSNKVVQNQDMKVQSFWTSFLSGFSLPEVFYSVIFGPGAINIRDPSDKKSAYRNKMTSLRGIGNFSKSGSLICTIGPEPSIKSKPKTDGKNVDAFDIKSVEETLGKTIQTATKLSYWQSVLDHKVTLFDMYTMARDIDKIAPDGSLDKSKMNARLDYVRNTSLSSTTQKQRLTTTYFETEIDRIITYIGTRPDQYPVDGGRLMILMPRSLGVNNNNILVKGLINAYPLKSDFTTVGQILFDTISRIEFSMYCSPRGDIVVEPPLCDFNPDDFNLTFKREERTNSTSMWTDLRSEHDGDYVTAWQMAIGEDQYGSKLNEQDIFSNNYIIPIRDTISVTSTLTDEKVHTIAVTKHAIFQNWDSLPYSDIVGKLNVAKRENLVPLYGVRAAPISDRGYINSPEAAQLYAEITLNRLNADAHTFKVDMMPNVKAWINRPFYVEYKNIIATSRSVNDSITWGKNGDMTTSIELNYARTWDGSIDENGNMVYTTIGGYASKPFNYAVLFGVAPRIDKSIDKDWINKVVNLRKTGR